LKKQLLILLLLTHLGSNAQKLTESNYGMVLNGNFTTIHSKFENYVGRGMGSFGIFYQRPFSPYHANRYLNRLDFIVEPSMNWLGYRDNTSEKRYTSTYIDMAFYVNYVPDRMSDDLRLFCGIRPSVLTYSKTSIIEFGTYKELPSDTQNLNVNGDLDFCGVVGVSVNMGSVASLELKYVHSFTNKITATAYQGRPSIFEIGLRLSAVRLKTKMVDEEANLVAEVNKKAQGTLLVMLEEPDEKLIEQLLADKKIEDANYVKKLQEQTNKNIIKEFRNNFDFCKVEFFSNNNAHKVNRGDFSDIFLDDNLLPKPSVSFDTANYFIASFIEDVSQLTQKMDYGLYFYDHKFIQLGKPYNSTSNGMGIFAGGDPQNYIRRIKTSGYFPEDFRKIIKKTNARLQLARIAVN